ncbi:hypothetical protein RND81_06G124600 [Saponaria officinalis]|uniref:Endonuclease/exonuclease/phosphatase domain-containing protein n=1 Tax=Saponaria officinalis TaxID=3572 RepID=A0AAW1KAU2_SAPOF
MKFCAWNVRGCNDPLKMKEVLDFLSGNQLDVLGILETRIKEKRARKLFLTKFRAYGVFHNYDAHYNGRIWVVWNMRSVTDTMLSSGSQYVHCYVHHFGSGKRFHLTFVYASNDSQAHAELWSSLRLISSSVEEWAVVGDFNVVRDVQERISESPPCLSDILEFNSCLLSCGLDDLKSSGIFYTWTNKQDDEARVWSKLDRALVNPPWLDSFVSSSATFLPAGVFDHSSTLVTVFEAKRHSPRFSFLNCWIEDSNYSTLVREAWDISVSGTAMFRFFTKLKNVRGYLCGLHQKRYSNIQERLRQAKLQLDECQRTLQLSPLNFTVLQMEKQAVSQYMKLRRSEMNILKQRAKFDNVVHNDSSSRVFYARINERKHTQIIGEIQDHRGRTKRGLDQVA